MKDDHKLSVWELAVCVWLIGVVFPYAIASLFGSSISLKSEHGSWPQIVIQIASLIFATLVAWDYHRKTK